jgi:hypothetical protein
VRMTSRGVAALLVVTTAVGWTVPIDLLSAWGGGGSAGGAGGGTGGGSAGGGEVEQEAPVMGALAVVTTPTVDSVPASPPEASRATLGM